MYHNTLISCYCVSNSMPHYQMSHFESCVIVGTLQHPAFKQNSCHCSHDIFKYISCDTIVVTQLKYDRNVVLIAQLTNGHHLFRQELRCRTDCKPALLTDALCVIRSQRVKHIQVSYIASEIFSSIVTWLACSQFFVQSCQLLNSYIWINHCVEFIILQIEISVSISIRRSYKTYSSELVD